MMLQLECDKKLMPKKKDDATMTPRWQWVNDAPMTMGQWHPEENETVMPRWQCNNDAPITMRHCHWGVIVVLLFGHHGRIVIGGVIVVLSFVHHCRIVIRASLSLEHHGCIVFGVVIVTLSLGHHLSHSHRGIIVPLSLGLHCFIVIGASFFFRLIIWSSLSHSH